MLQRAQRVPQKGKEKQAGPISSLLFNLMSRTRSHDYRDRNKLACLFWIRSEKYTSEFCIESVIYMPLPEVKKENTDITT